MIKYFLHDGTEQKGPFDLEEIKTKKIKKDTLIWYDGLTDWTPASQIDELHDIFKVAVPPPLKKQVETPSENEPRNSKRMQQNKQDKRLGRVLRRIGIIGVVTLISFIIYSSYLDKKRGDALARSNLYNQPTYEQKVISVEETEKMYPSRFLKAGGTYNQNFWGDKMKIHGTIENTATVANYKDALVEVIFYTKTDTEIKRERYSIFDYFPAHSTKHFELKIGIPSNCKKLGWETVSATAN